MDWLQVKEELIGAWPPGTDQVIDWQDDPGRLIEALAKALADHGVAPVEALRRELHPLTCTPGLGLDDWERALRIDGTETAQYGTADQRRRQLWGRLRERGAATLAMIRGVLQPFLLYSGMGDILISEVSRDDLRTAHTRVELAPLVLFAYNPDTVTWRVLDDPVVSQAGAQVDLTFSAATEVGGMVASLTAPDGKVHEWAYQGRGIATTIRLYAKSLAGAAIRGVWTLTLATTNNNTLTRADLFVEGLGRTSTGGDGLGAAKFEWGIIAEEAKLGSGYDLRGAELAIARITYATRVGYLIRRSSGMGAPPPGNNAAIPDDPGAIPNACIPG